MDKKLSDYTQDELDLEWEQAQVTLRSLGEAYNACPDNAYYETEYGIINLAEDVSEQIQDTYCWIGFLMEEYEKRNINTPLWG